MTDRKTFLNQFIDLGGVATKNNFYSIKSQNPKGCLINARKLFKEFEIQGLIKRLSTITKVRNLVQEEYYAITKAGAAYVGRTADYQGSAEPKSPFNVMHESMVRDIIMGFLRNYPDYSFVVDYHTSYEGLRPDATIRLFHKETVEQYIFFLEIERKAVVERILNEKINKYEEMFKKINFQKYKLNAPVKVLIVFSNLDFNCFLRPQMYNDNDLVKLNKQFSYLIKLCNNLPDNRYRFLPFPYFYKLHEQVWRTPSGKVIKLLN